MLDLEETFAEERKVGIDAALSKLEEEHNQQIDELRAKHEKELRALEGLLIDFIPAVLFMAFCLKRLLGYSLQSVTGSSNH